MAGIIQGAISGFLEVALKGASNVALDTTLKGIKDFTTEAKFLQGVDWTSISPLGSLGYWEEIYSTLGKVNTQLGVSGNLAKELNTVAVDSLSSVAAVGGDIGDISDAYSNFIDKYGRATLVDTEGITDMVKLQKAFGEDFSEMLVTTKLTGKSIKSTYDFINKASKQASKQGVLIGKVIKSINKNIGMLDEMNFVNGIRGLEKMAIMSEKTMINMDTAQKLADSLQDIDGAIEFSTNAQMMGGEIAKVFGNASRLAYEARNAPDELMKRVTEVAKGMAHIGTDGSIQISSFNRQQFRELEKMSNSAISATELARAAKISYQEELVKEALLQQGINNITDDMVTKLTSVSELNKNGEVSFNLGTDGLKSASDVANEISQSGSDLLSKLDTVSKAATDPTEAMLQNNLATGEKITNMLNTMFTKLVDPTLYNKLSESTTLIVGETNKVVDGVDGVSNSVMKFFKELQGNGYKELETRYGDLFDNMLNGDGSGLEKLIDKAKVVTDGIHNFDLGMQGAASSLWEKPLETLKNILFTFVKTLGGSIIWVMDTAARNFVNLFIGALNTSSWFDFEKIKSTSDIDVFGSLKKMTDDFVKQGSQISPDGKSFFQTVNKGFNDIMTSFDSKNVGESKDEKKLNKDHELSSSDHSKYLDSVRHNIESVPNPNGGYNNVMTHNGGMDVNINIKSDVPIDDMTPSQRKDFSNSVYKEVQKEIQRKYETQNGDISTIPENKTMQR